LNDLIDVIIEEKATLFVCAIGVPPKEIVQKLHDAGIVVMNMVGHPKHVAKALAVGVDLICAQGGEGGGHTGGYFLSTTMKHELTCDDVLYRRYSVINSHSGMRGPCEGPHIASDWQAGVRCWCRRRVRWSQSCGQPHVGCSGSLGMSMFSFYEDGYWQCIIELMIQCLGRYPLCGKH
jgi:hypothetical protein